MFRKTFQHILFITFFAITTINAQVVDSALVGDSTKILNETGLNESDKPSVRKHHAKLKDGMLELDNVLTIDGKSVAGLNLDIKEELKSMGLPENASDNLVKRKVDIEMNGEGEGVYLVFDSAILLVMAQPDAKPNSEGKEPYLGGTYGVAGVQSLDNSKIFTHEGSIYTSSNGSFVATTPTTLLVITSSDAVSISYENIFGKIPPLKKPTITGGRTPDEAFIRDETMRDETKAVRIELNLITLDITVEKDVD